MTETIKPCPFCGEPEELDINVTPEYKYVNCLTCEARGPYADIGADAILLWNAASNAQERERNRWIPVSEKLPEDEENVLVNITEVDGSPVIDFGYYTPGNNAFEGWQTNYFMAFGKVTHWRPLPEPPEQLNS